MEHSARQKTDANGDTNGYHNHMIINSNNNRNNSNNINNNNNNIKPLLPNTNTIITNESRIITQNAFVNQLVYKNHNTTIEPTEQYQAQQQQRQQQLLQKQYIQSLSLSQKQENEKEYFDHPPHPSSYFSPPLPLDTMNNRPILQSVAGNSNTASMEHTHDNHAKDELLHDNPLLVNNHNINNNKRNLACANSNSNNNEPSKSERKRRREMKRRSDVNKGFDGLISILSDRNPLELRNAIQQQPEQQVTISDTTAPIASLLNRVDLMDVSTRVMERLYEENSAKVLTIQKLQESLNQEKLKNKITMLFPMMMLPPTSSDLPQPQSQQQPSQSSNRFAHIPNYKEEQLQQRHLQNNAHGTTTNPWMSMMMGSSQLQHNNNGIVLPCSKSKNNCATNINTRDDGDKRLGSNTN